ncbi:MAG: peptidoglycan-binding protein [Candidatus Sungbacteria bacterium]|nr:peptidoglycan-binding protein [Candidatus Sungbacteria bacterium]
MSNALKARLKVAVVSAATAVSITGAMALLPNVVRAVTIDELLAQIAALQAQITQLQGGSQGGGTAAKCSFTRSLTVGSRGDDVKCLQQYLNASGYQVSASGAGSAGSETTYFGPATRAAVGKWQAGNGVSPAAGYFGPLSQAKYNSLVAGAPSPTPSPTPTPTPAPTPAGSGLTVASAGAQPAETLAPESAARMPFIRLTLTASNDGDVTVKSITVKREGLADDAIFDGIILLDENANQVGNSKTLNANHQAALDGSFVVKKGTSKTVTIAANMAASLDSYAGQVVKLSVVAVDAGSSAVSGSLPVSSNGMTVNGTLSIGTFATPVRGATDPGADATKEVGTKNFVFSAVKFTAGSAEDVLVKSLRWDQSGSASASDLKNVKIVVGTTEYATENDGKKYWATFGDGITVAKGANIEMAIKGDIEGGSNRTITFDIEKKQDIVALGKTYGYYLTPGGGSSGACTDGNFSSNQEPYFCAYDHTINTGTLRVEKSNSVAATNIPVDITNTDLGAFTFEAKGEEVQVTSITVDFTISSSNSASTSDLTGVRIVDANGSTVAGPKDPASGLVTFTDTWNIPTGVNVYKFQAKPDTTFVTNDTILVELNTGNMTAKGLVTGKTITVAPSSTAINGNTQTVRAAGLSVSVASTPVAQSVVRGLNGFLFSKFQYDATNSGEDIRVTSQAITFTTSSTADADDLNNCVFYDGTAALNTGTNVVTPSGNAAGADPTATVTFDNHLIVPKGSTKVIDVKCNIGAAFVADSTISIGIAASQDTAATGVTTGTSVTESLTTSVGQTMTVRSGGSFTVALDASSPSERWVIAGVANQTMSVFKLHATNEALKLDKFHVQFNGATASSTEFSKMTLWDGATKVGEAVWTGSDVTATSTLTADFIIPKDGDKLLTVKADVTAVGVSEPAGPGRLLRVDFDGDATTSTTAIGQSSGSSFNVTTSADVTGNGGRIAKAYPTLARLSVPSNTLSNGSMSLYRFSVTAPASGDIGLNKFTFDVSSTTVATTSAFSVYGYSDSAFSVQAYNNNPLNSTTDSDTGTVQVFFDPSAQGGTTAALNEAVQVPAGTTRYFELKATLASVATGDTINVSLLGDAAYWARNTNNFFMASSSGIAADTNGDFVWSPNTTTTSATTTNDWANGFRLPGLPSTNMEQQSFSKS